MSVSREVVAAAVARAMGSACGVSSWRVKNLTSAGDNFATTVKLIEAQLATTHGNTSVKRDTPETTEVEHNRNTSCLQTNNNEDISEISKFEFQPIIHHCDSETIDENSNLTQTKQHMKLNSITSHEKNQTTWTCVCKLNSGNESIFFKIFTKFAFENEIRFYTKLLPELNRELLKCKIALLSVPQYYYSDLKDKNEVLLIEDLKRSGFQMISKPNNLNFNQCVLALRELARLHSASMLFKLNAQKKISYSLEGSNISTKMIEKQSIFEENYLSKDGPLMNINSGLVKNRIDDALDFLKSTQGTDKAIAWLQVIQDDVPKFLRTMLCDCKPEFKVLCHGDTWTNNFLFRSLPAPSVCMLDFQLTRSSSLATDINYLLYTSMTGAGDDMERLMDAYYDSYSTVMQAQGYKAGFSRSELSQEVASKQAWGVIGGVIVLPMLVRPELDPVQATTDGAGSRDPAVEKQTKRWSADFREKCLGLFVGVNT